MAVNQMEHKGYFGSIEVSMEDEILFGKVLGVESLLMYSAETPAELFKEFKKIVEVYLSSCEQRGISPEKACSGTFNVRVGSELHRQASLMANRIGVKLNEFVKRALAEEIERLTHETAIVPVSRATVPGHAKVVRNQFWITPPDQKYGLEATEPDWYEDPQHGGFAASVQLVARTKQKH